MRVPAATALVATAVLVACSGPAPEPAPSQPPLPTADTNLATFVPEAIRADGRLTVGTDPTYPPLEFLADDGVSVQGADIDLVSGIATLLGLKPEFRQDSFTAIPTGVRTGRYELGASGISVPRDARMLDNAVLYLKSGTRLVRDQDDPGLVPDDMCGYKVSALEGSVQIQELAKASDRCRRSGRPVIRIEGFPDQIQSTESVVSHSSDGFLADAPVASHIVREYRETLESAGPVFDEMPLGILTAIEFRSLTRGVKLALQQLIDTGYYDEVLSRWGIAEYGVDHADIRWADHVVRIAPAPQ